jgi:fructose-6-phosphate aldolase 2
MADTANLDELEQLMEYFPLKGVTTNPTLLKNSNIKISEFINKIQNLDFEMVHIQVMSDKCDDIVSEAKAYRARFLDKRTFYAKIPVSEQGLKAMRILKKQENINVTATAICTQQQALVAAVAGADYVAPYVSRLDNISSHGIQVVQDIVSQIDHFKLPTKVLAASFKTVDQIYRVALVGSHSATISADLLHLLLQHPMTDISIQTFKEHGKDLYDIPF